MPARLALALACILMASGCGSPTPPSTPAPAAGTSSDQAAPVGSPQFRDPTGPKDPVATLLSKPVYRRDCSNRTGDLVAIEVGFRTIVLAVLTNDACDPAMLTISDEELDAFWKTLQAGVRRSNNTLPETPPFDASKIQARLDETRGRLAAADLPWRTRLALEEEERALLFALERKTIAAGMYSQLMPLRREAALYKKYGGKVVAMQVSISPIEAYVKLVQEAEANGKLVFHDAALKQAFWNRMNEYMQQPEVPPERVDFSLPVWAQFAVPGPDR